MKTLKRLFALVMILALVAGCTMKSEAGLVISEDGKVSVSILSAYDDEMIDGMLSMDSMGEETTEQKTYTDAERWAFVEKDKKDNEKRYEKDGFKGLISTEEIGSLDDISATSAPERVNIAGSDEEATDEDEETTFELKNKTLFIKDGNKYKSNMTIDLGEEAASMQSYEDYGAAFEINFTITLPVKPISHNATKVSEDGKTLTWDLLKAKDIDVEFELGGKSAAKDDKKEDKENSESSNSNILLYVGIGVGALVVIGIIVAIVAASSKKKAPAPVADAPVMGPVMQPSQPVEPPVQPVQPVEPPVQPVQPVEQPVQPAEPAQPVDPNNMNNPQV